MELERLGRLSRVPGPRSPTKIIELNTVYTQGKAEDSSVGLPCVSAGGPSYTLLCQFFMQRQFLQRQFFMRRKPLYYINSLLNGKWTDLNININMNILAKVCAYMYVYLTAQQHH